jgi:hypothetical protein
MIDRITLPEYQEYVQMLLIYKKAKKDYPIFVSQYSWMKNSENPLERATWYDEKEKNTQINKLYYAVRAKYKDAAARAEFAVRKIDLSVVELAEIAAIEIPVSMRDIVKSERKVSDNSVYLQNPEVRRVFREIAIRDGLEIKPEWMETPEELAQASENEFSFNPDVSSDGKITFDEDFEMARRVMKERAEAKVAQEKLNSGDFTEVESEFDNGFDKL